MSLRRTALLGLGVWMLAQMGCQEIFSTDITGREVSVNGPADSLFTSDELVQFWWEADPDIEKYELQLASPDFNTGILVFDTLLLDNVTNIWFDPDWAYTWRLRGVNEGSESDWTTGTFFVDQTAPNKATALSMDGDTLAIGATDTLRWQARDLPLNDMAAAFEVRDSLYVSRVNDSTEFVIQLANALGDAQARLIGGADIPTSDPGDYWWRVVTIDRAGNRAESALFHYYILP